MMGKYEYLEQPCRNHCLFKGILLMDPKDGKEKIVLSSFVAGGIGEVLIIDPVTGQGETFQIPGDNGAWALLNYKDERLLVGTCGTYGYLHSLDLKTREWAPSLKVEGISYIWDLALGSDGMVYGGTYPGCVLLQYDPVKHTLVNLGPMTKDEGNLYSRLVFTPVEGKVYMNCGMASTCIGVYDIAKKEMYTVMEGCSINAATKDYLYVNTPSGNKLVRPDTFEEFENEAYLMQLTAKDDRLPTPASHVMALASGDKIGVCGQRLFMLKPDATKPTFMPIPGNPPPTEIFALTCDAEGILWGATGLGQTMFRYDPKTGDYWNTDIVTALSGEVYGIVALDGKIFMTAYCGGDHVVYDPKREWNQYENVNPKTLERIGPDYIRPQARSIIGPGNNIWTGWIARYGRYGCAITEINSKTLEVRKFTDLVPEQGIGSIAGDDKFIYFTTDGSGNGLKSKTEAFHLVKMSVDGEILHKTTFPVGTSLTAVYAVNGKVLLAVASRDGRMLHVYDRDTMTLLRAFDIEYAVGRVIPMKNGHLLASVRKFSGEKRDHMLVVFNPATGDIVREMEVPGHVYAFCYNDTDGYYYFGHGTKLYRMK